MFSQLQDELKIPEPTSPGNDLNNRTSICAFGTDFLFSFEIIVAPVCIIAYFHLMRADESVAFHGEQPRDCVDSPHNYTFLFSNIRCFSSIARKVACGRRVSGVMRDAVHVSSLLITLHVFRVPGKIANPRSIGMHWSFFNAILIKLYVTCLFRHVSFILRRHRSWNKSS